MVEVGGGRLEGARCPRTEVGLQAEWLSRPSDLRAAGTVTCRQRGQAAWAGRGCEAANPSSDLPRRVWTCSLPARVWKQGLPQAVRTLLEIRPVSEETADVWREEPGLLGKDVLTQPSKGLGLGPQNYHTPQVDPETFRGCQL